MSATLNDDESEIIGILRQSGIAPASAALAVVMVTREHSRPESELADIVRQYQGLESAPVVENAIADLKQRGWLEEYTSYGMTLIRQAADLRARIADFAGDKKLRRKLKEMRSALDPYVDVIGEMNDDEVYLSYLELLRTAHSEILLPMLATTPKLESVPILIERARSGVSVRILLADPKLVVRLRGATMRKAAEDSIEGWTRNASGIPNMEVRIVRHLDDTYMSTCMFIDGRLLRLDVYDPHRQRSLQGVMVEFRSPDGLELNVVRMFKSQFEVAWNRASPSQGVGRLLWELKRFWHFVLMTVFTVLALVVDNSAVSGIFGSAAATFLVTGLAASWDWLRSVWTSWTRR